MNSTLKILNTELELITYQDLFDEVNNNIRNRKIKNIITCDFRDIEQIKKYPLKIDNVLYYPDSTGMFLALKMFYSNEVKNFKKLISTDFHYKLLGIAEEKKYNIFILGDTSEIQNKFINKICETHPNLQIVGNANGFDDLKNKNLIQRINNSAADIILIGLGIPRQANWLAQNSEKLNIPIRITVGAFFTFYSGEIKRAPLIIRKLSLEWLYRFLKEPNRLFKRYFITFPKIFLLIGKERWKKSN